MPEIKCPKCDAAISFGEADVGKVVTCSSCGADVLAAEGADQLISLKCTGCGGTIDLRPGMAEALCPYCGAKYLLPAAAAPAAAKGDVAEYLTPFRVLRNNMLEYLNKWLNEGVFTASDADTAAAVTKVTAKYVPLYICTCDATSAWSGQNSTTRYRTVTKTRTTAQGSRQTYTEQEPYKEWHAAAGTHTGRYRLAVVAASGLRQEDLDKLTAEPGNFTNDEGAEPFGQVSREDNFPLEKATIDAAEATRRAKMKVDALERAACDAEVERLDSCSTQIANVAVRLSYHPIWWITYSYKGKPYNCLMDGRTGAVAGKKPISKTKVIIAVVAVVIIVTLLILAVLCFGGGYCLSTSSLINNLVEGAWALV